MISDESTFMRFLFADVVSKIDNAGPKLYSDRFVIQCLQYGIP